MSGAKTFTPTSSTLTIKFDNPRMAYHFKLWLCEAGEQDYWEWMEVRRLSYQDIREAKEEGPITVDDFDYHSDCNGITGKADRDEGDDTCSNTVL